MIFTFKDMSAAIINRKWITTKEIWGVTHLLVLSTGLVEYLSDFKLFTTRLVTLWRKSGKKFLCLYLKEATACVIAFLNHTRRVTPQGAPRVRLSRAGLPTIIPGPLRTIIVSFRLFGGMKDRLVTRIVLTVLSLYRVMNFVSKPNLATITAPFNGVSPLFQELELGKVLSLFKVYPLKGVTWNISESAGPNGPRATWFAGVDAIAWVSNPTLLVRMYMFMFLSEQYVALCWLILIQVTIIPGMLLLILLRGLKVVPSKLGRLTALNKDGAGKRRIIAIADWWTQLVFKPYHSSLFRTLKDIEQDGTFDQWAPVENWVLPRIRLGFPAFSFDLTAATDRLPIQFQTQVFSMLFGAKVAWLWTELLDRDWWFQGKPIRYAVGQPIGALSSWAMLAICHHVVVQLAAQRAGWNTWFPYYAVLGDDLVIADKHVADNYLAIMRQLGVPINLSKSLISETGFIEFAKRWMSGSRGEMSAIGPGLLLAVLRNVYLFPVLVLQLFQRDWIHFPKQLENALAQLSKVRRNIDPKMVALMFATIIGPSGLLRNARHVTAFAEAWFTAITKLPMGSAIGFVIQAFQAMVTIDMADKASTARDNLEFFIANWMKYPVIRGDDLVAAVFSIPLILVSPGFWIYLTTLWKGRNPSYSASLNLYGILNPDKAAEPGAIQFSLLDVSDMASINWTQRQTVKTQFAVTTDLMKTVQGLVEYELRNTSSLALTVLDEATSQIEE
jgi:hypothetical protein